MTNSNNRHVALTWSPSAEELETVHRALPGIHAVHLTEDKFALTRWGSRPEPIADLLRQNPKVDAIIGWARLPLWALQPATDLKFISWLHAGCDELDLPRLAERGVQVANVRGANGSVVAEHAMALMLGLAKRLLPNDSALRNGMWQGWWDERSAITELRGATVCIVGFGNIAKPLAKLCSGFGMEVLAVRRSPASEGDSSRSTVASIGGPDSLYEFLRRSQFVILALPLTHETRGIVNSRFLAAMPAGAFLINVARGDLVDEESVAEALQSGRLGGFASDVWWNYDESWPPGFPKVSRLGVHKMPNVLCTGDAAADLLVIHDRMLSLGLENLQEYFAGKPPTRLVDPTLGY